MENIEFIKNLEFSKIGEKAWIKQKAEALKKLRPGEEELVYGVPAEGKNYGMWK